MERDCLIIIVEVMRPSSVCSFHRENVDVLMLSIGLDKFENRPCVDFKWFLELLSF